MDEEFEILQNRPTDILAEQLCEAIKASDEYKGYQELLKQIKEHHELYMEVNELRREHFRLQNSNGSTMSHEIYSNISSRSANLRENPLVNDFLNAEIGLGRLIQSINEKLMSGIEFDDDFLTY